MRRRIFADRQALVGDQADQQDDEAQNRREDGTADADVGKDHALALRTHFGGRDGHRSAVTQLDLPRADHELARRDAAFNLDLAAAP